MKSYFYNFVIHVPLNKFKAYWNPHFPPNYASGAGQMPETNNSNQT